MPMQPAVNAPAGSNQRLFLRCVPNRLGRINDDIHRNLGVLLAHKRCRCELTGTGCPAASSSRAFRASSSQFPLTAAALRRLAICTTCVPKLLTHWPSIDQTRNAADWGMRWVSMMPSAPASTMRLNISARNGSRSHFRSAVDWHEQMAYLCRLLALANKVTNEDQFVLARSKIAPDAAQAQSRPDLSLLTSTVSSKSAMVYDDTDGILTF